MPLFTPSQKNYRPYTDEERSVVLRHLNYHFGIAENFLSPNTEFENDGSPDVLLTHIGYTNERDYDTYCTVGLGAYPLSFSSFDVPRVELMIALPPEWDLDPQSQFGTWPLHLLKTVSNYVISERSSMPLYSSIIDLGTSCSPNSPFTQVMLIPGMPGTSQNYKKYVKYREVLSRISEGKLPVELIMEAIEAIDLNKVEDANLRNNIEQIQQTKISHRNSSDNHYTTVNNASIYEKTIQLNLGIAKNDETPSDTSLREIIQDYLDLHISNQALNINDIPFSCELPNGEQVYFFMVIPLHEDEAAVGDVSSYKNVFNLLSNRTSFVITPQRRSVVRSNSKIFVDARQKENEILIETQRDYNILARKKNWPVIDFSKTHYGPPLTVNPKRSFLLESEYRNHSPLARIEDFREESPKVAEDVAQKQRAEIEQIQPEVLNIVLEDTSTKLSLEEFIAPYIELIKPYIDNTKFRKRGRAKIIASKLAATEALTERYNEGGEAAVIEFVRNLVPEDIDLNVHETSPKVTDQAKAAVAAAAAKANAATAASAATAAAAIAAADAVSTATAASAGANAKDAVDPELNRDLMAQAAQIRDISARLLQQMNGGSTDTVTTDSQNVGMSDGSANPDGAISIDDGLDETQSVHGSPSNDANFDTSFIDQFSDNVEPRSVIKPRPSNISLDEMSLRYLRDPYLIKFVPKEAMYGLIVKDHCFDNNKLDVMDSMECEYFPQDETFSDIEASHRSNVLKFKWASGLQFHYQIRELKRDEYESVYRDDDKSHSDSFLSPHEDEYEDEDLSYVNLDTLSIFNETEDSAYIDEDGDLAQAFQNNPQAYWDYSIAMVFLVFAYKKKLFDPSFVHYHANFFKKLDYFNVYNPNQVKELYQFTKHVFSQICVDNLALGAPTEFFYYCLNQQTLNDDHEYLLGNTEVRPDLLSVVSTLLKLQSNSLRLFTDDYNKLYMHPFSPALYEALYERFNYLFNDMVNKRYQTRNVEEADYYSRVLSVLVPFNTEENEKLIHAFSYISSKSTSLDGILAKFDSHLHNAQNFDLIKEVVIEGEPRQLIIESSPQMVNEIINFDLEHAASFLKSANEAVSLPLADGFIDSAEALLNAQGRVLIGDKAICEYLSTHIATLAMLDEKLPLYRFAYTKMERQSINKFMDTLDKSYYELPIDERLFDPLTLEIAADEIKERHLKRLNEVRDFVYKHLSHSASRGETDLYKCFNRTTSYAAEVRLHAIHQEDQVDIKNVWTGPYIDGEADEVFYQGSPTRRDLDGEIYCQFYGRDSRYEERTSFRPLRAEDQKRLQANKLSDMLLDIENNRINKLKKHYRRRFDSLDAERLTQADAALKHRLRLTNDELQDIQFEVNFKSCLDTSDYGKGLIDKRDALSNDIKGNLHDLNLPFNRVAELAFAYSTDRHRLLKSVLTFKQFMHDGFEQKSKGFVNKFSNQLVFECIEAHDDNLDTNYEHQVIHPGLYQAQNPSQTKSLTIKYTGGSKIKHLVQVLPFANCPFRHDIGLIQFIVGFMEVKFGAVLTAITSDAIEFRRDDFDTQSDTAFNIENYIDLIYIFDLLEVDVDRDNYALEALRYSAMEVWTFTFNSCPSRDSLLEHGFKSPVADQSWVAAPWAHEPKAEPQIQSSVVTEECLDTGVIVLDDEVQSQDQLAQDVAQGQDRALGQDGVLGQDQAQDEVSVDTQNASSAAPAAKGKKQAQGKGKQKGKGKGKIKVNLNIPKISSIGFSYPETKDKSRKSNKSYYDDDLTSKIPDAIWNESFDSASKGSNPELDAMRKDIYENSYQSEKRQSDRKITYNYIAKNMQRAFDNLKKYRQLTDIPEPLSTLNYDEPLYFFNSMELIEGLRNLKAQDEDHDVFDGSDLERFQLIDNFLLANAISDAGGGIYTDKIQHVNEILKKIYIHRAEVAAKRAAENNFLSAEEVAAYENAVKYAKQGKFRQWPEMETINYPHVNKYYLKPAHVIPHFNHKASIQQNNGAHLNSELSNADALMLNHEYKSDLEMKRQHHEENAAETVKSTASSILATTLNEELVDLYTIKDDPFLGDGRKTSRNEEIKQELEKLHEQNQAQLDDSEGQFNVDEAALISEEPQIAEDSARATSAQNANSAQIAESAEISESAESTKNAVSAQSSQSALSTQNEDSAESAHNITSDQVIMAQSEVEENVANQETVEQSMLSNVFGIMSNEQKDATAANRDQELIRKMREAKIARKTRHMHAISESAKHAVDGFLVFNKIESKIEPGRYYSPEKYHAMRAINHACLTANRSFGCPFVFRRENTITTWSVNFDYFLKQEPHLLPGLDDSLPELAKHYVNALKVATKIDLSAHVYTITNIWKFVDNIEEACEAVVRGLIDYNKIKPCIKNCKGTTVKFDKKLYAKHIYAFRNRSDEYEKLVREKANFDEMFNDDYAPSRILDIINQYQMKY